MSVSTDFVCHTCRVVWRGADSIPFCQRCGEQTAESVSVPEPLITKPISACSDVRAAGVVVVCTECGQIRAADLPHGGKYSPIVPMAIAAI